MNDENTGADAEHPKFPVVGIGASAGALGALTRFFRHLDARSGAAYGIVVHLSPDHASSIDEILQRETALTVTSVTQPIPIRPDHVYVISPRSRLAMRDGMIVPEPMEKGRAQGTTINAFFATLAEAHGERAVGIVLSGTGSDGTAGLRTIKAHGGIALAQAPEDAEYDTMPRNAIASGAADFVLPAAEMPAKLATLWRASSAIQLPMLEDTPTPEDVVARAEDALRDVLAIVRTRTGHDFAQYKRATLLRRIERRLQVNQVRDLPGYRDYLRDHPDESRHLLRDLLISVTSFFRDPEVFAQIDKQVLPALFKDRGHGGNLRVWVVGCATGEEAYSLAMLLTEHAQRTASPVEVNIFATDIDEEALAFARHGLYPDTIREHLSTERLRRFFVKEPDGYRVQKSLRELVMFAAHNVIQDPPFSKLDLVVCRNLLIYLSRKVQTKVLDLLHFALRPEGFLVLGLSEAVDDRHDGFSAADKTLRIYQQQPRARAGPLLATLPMMSLARVQGEAAAVPGRRLVSYSDLHHSLLEHYAPPSLVVDEHGEVVHVSENAGRLLQVGSGEPSLNLFRIAPEELRHELRSMLDQALQSMRTVQRRGLPLRRGSDVASVDITVHAVREKTTTRTFALVIFDEQVADDTAAGPAQAEGATDAVASRLEARLHDTQAQLRAALEQYEIQNEELKASNEELQATNEELRATSEELETGKEELQSINEELTTVNQELKNKVDETTRISDDLQNFIASTEIAVVFVDRQMRLMRFTPFAREIFNVIGSDIGRPLLDITDKLQGVPLEQDVLAVFETLRVVEREVRTTGGRWYILRILPYRTVEDRIGGAVLTFIDITQRRQAEEAAQRGRAWLQLVVDSIVDYAILTLDPQGRIQGWNRGAEQIFGYPASEAVGQHFALLFPPEDRQAGVPQRELEEAQARGRAEDDRWMLRRDGSRFFASGQTAPLVDGASHGYVKLLRDLTDRQLASDRRDEQLAAEVTSREALQRSNRLKDEFLATLSHELRNPLALVLMQAELLLRAPEIAGLERVTQCVQGIHRLVRTQAQFVEDLLDVSRARTGKLAIQRQLVPLPFIVADSIGAMRQQAEAAEITLDVDLPDEPLIVEADAVRVKQVVWNLLSNALKFTQAGGRVRIALSREGGDARLDVIDNGSGIPPEALPRVFDWFHQGEAGTRRRKGGLGIGLALVKQLVELHGGRVQATSEGVGKGARFTAWLPLQAGEQGSVYALPTPPVTGRARLAGLALLLVDDEPDSAQAMGMLLEWEGAKVVCESRATAALALAGARAFDAIVSDVGMPEMDGYELVRRIRAGGPNAATPAIAYSGYGGEDEVARALDAGFTRHLTKPLDVDALVEAILSVTRNPAR